MIGTRADDALITPNKKIQKKSKVVQEEFSDTESSSDSSGESSESAIDSEVNEDEIALASSTL
jgi:hypothetical protein